MLRQLLTTDSHVYKAVFWMTFSLWIIPELVASRLMRSRGHANSHDRGSLNVVAVLWSVGIGLDFACTRFLPSAHISQNTGSLFFIGIATMLAGVLLRWYSVSVLGKYFTFDVAIHTGHQLVESGPYRLLRHPSYTGALITLAGLGFALGNWLAVFIGTFSLMLAYVYRIQVEEAALTAELGESYVDYCKRTWRLIPFVY